MTCVACLANEVAAGLRSEYLSEAHRAALDLAVLLRGSHSGCSLDPGSPLADRMLVDF